MRQQLRNKIHQNQEREEEEEITGTQYSPNEGNGAERTQLIEFGEKLQNNFNLFHNAEQYIKQVNNTVLGFQQGSVGNIDNLHTVLYVVLLNTMDEKYMIVIKDRT